MEWDITFKSGSKFEQNMGRVSSAAPGIYFTFTSGYKGDIYSNSLRSFSACLFCSRRLMSLFGRVVPCGVLSMPFFLQFFTVGRAFSTAPNLYGGASIQRSPRSLRIFPELISDLFGFIHVSIFMPPPHCISAFLFRNSFRSSHG
jgi:hypothetical protein